MYRFDEGFDYFLKKFGAPFESVPIDESVMTAYKHKLPEQIFTYWRGVGACGVGEGLFWMVNPAEYQETLDSWLEGTPFEDRDDLSVIARTAFGVLYVWAKGKGHIMTVYPTTNAINYFPEDDANNFSDEDEIFELQSFWGFTSTEEVDYEDENDDPMFQKALKKFGRLHADEMYGFSFSPALGGTETMENLSLVKLHIYHDISRQLGGVQIVTIEL